MSVKNVNRLFLAFFVVEAVVSVLLSVSDWQPGTMGMLVLSQGVLLVPAVVFLIISRTKLDFISHKKQKICTPVLAMAYTALCMPVIMLANLVSMLFVENEVSNLTGLLIDVPGWQILLLIGILGPINEEFIFRGIIYHSYRKEAGVFAGMLLSAFLFGLMHLNLNQMSYAILVGILTVLLIEATGSILNSMIFHICVNTYNVIIMISQKNVLDGVTDSQQVLEDSISALGLTYHQFLQIAIAFFGCVSAVTLVMAGLLLYGMACIEGRREHLISLFKRKDENESGEKHKSLFSISLVIAIAAYIIYLIYRTIIG